MESQINIEDIKKQLSKLMWQYQKHKYETNPEFKEKALNRMKKSVKQRYHNDPEYKKKQLEATKARYEKNKKLVRDMTPEEKAEHKAQLKLKNKLSD